MSRQSRSKNFLFFRPAQKGPVIYQGYRTFSTENQRHSSSASIDDQIWYTFYKRFLWTGGMIYYVKKYQLFSFTAKKVYFYTKPLHKNPGELACVFFIFSLNLDHWFIIQNYGSNGTASLWVLDFDPGRPKVTGLNRAEQKIWPIFLVRHSI